MVVGEAEFNSAFVFLNRLEVLFGECVEARYSRNAVKWDESISCLFAELSNYMSDDDRSSRLLELFSLKMDVNRCVKRGGVSKDLYEKLFIFELWLRKVKKDAGLEMRFKDDISKVLFKGGY